MPSSLRFHPKAMPVILTTPEEVDLWLEAETPDALKLQRPLPNRILQIEPLRVDRRLFRLSHAAMAGSFSMA
jgi:putative SOS response-associated peptidase YedK